MRTLLIIAICCLFFQDASAQPEVSNLSYSKLKRLGESAMKSKDIHMALVYFNQMNEKKPNKYEILEQLAELERAIRNYESALSAYVSCYDIDPEKDPENLLHIADMNKSLANYEKAIDYYERFIKKIKRESEYRPLKKIAQKSLDRCKVLISDENKKENVRIESLGKEINGPHIEFNPYLLNDSTLIYGSLKETQLPIYSVDSITKRRKFYSANLLKQGWVHKGEWEPEMFNENADYGNGCFNIDSTRFYYSVCKKKWNNEIQCELHVADFIDNRLENGKPLDLVVNTPNTNNSQPIVGSEKKKGKEIIYFVSNRKGGKGGLDVWYTIYDFKKKKYKEPKNAGSKVNSSFNEMTPYYDEKTKKLYFSSNRPESMGGYDVFEARGKGRTWSKPIGLKMPINSNADEIYYKVKTNGEEGFFTSNRSGGSQLFHPTCCDDIYSFSFLNEVFLKINGVIVDIPDSLYIKGVGDKISDIHNYVKLNKVEMDIYLKQEGEEILMDSKLLDKEGLFQLTLENEMDYRIEFKKKGYFSNFIDVSTKNQDISDSLEVNIGLSKLDGKTFIIPNIYYDFDSSVLSQDAEESLMNSVFQVLKENPTFKIEIGSHTDNKGSGSYNLRLSKERAERVVQFLIEKGVDKNRISSRGYGESVPIHLNEFEDGTDNPEGRKKNRRTEFKILKY